MRVKGGRPNGGPSPRVSTVAADTLSKLFYIYSKGLRQTFDRIGVVTRQEEYSVYVEEGAETQSSSYWKISDEIKLFSDMIGSLIMLHIEGPPIELNFLRNNKHSGGNGDPPHLRLHSLLHRYIQEDATARCQRKG